MVRRGLNEIGADVLRVVAVSRFSNPAASAALRLAVVETIFCDLTIRAVLAALPDFRNVLYLVGQQFGTHESPENTRFINTIVSALIAERSLQSLIVALTTDCVYPLAAIDGQGSSERESLRPDQLAEIEGVWRIYPRQNDDRLVTETSTNGYSPR